MAAAPLRRRSAAPVARTARAVAAPAPVRRPVRPKARPAGGAVAKPTVRVHGAALLDRLLAGRLWIGLIFALLVGIVFFNVDLLRMNRDIAVTAERSETLKRQNARLRGDLARLGSSERIQKVAAESGLVLPAPGEVRYLTPDAKADPRNAATQLDREDDGTDAASSIPPAQSGGSSGAATQGETPTTQGQAPAAATETATPQAQAVTPEATTPQATPQTQTQTQTAAPAAGTTTATPTTQQQGAATAPTPGQ